MTDHTVFVPSKTFSGRAVRVSNDAYLSGLLTGDDTQVITQEGLDMLADTTGQHTAGGLGDNADARIARLCVNNIICDKIQLPEPIGTKKLYNTLLILNDTVNQIDAIGTYDPFISRALQNIYIYNTYDDRRAFATHTDVTFFPTRIDPVQLRMVMTHEMGHIIDLGIVQGVSTKLHDAYTEFGDVTFSVDDPSLAFYAYTWVSEKTRIVNSSRKDFCSLYGMTNIFEDFAECMHMYLTHHDLFVRMKTESPILTQKYQYIASLFGNKYLTDNMSNVVYATGERYWDSTKMQ